MNNRLVCVYVSAIVLAVAGCAQSAHQTGQDLLDRVIPREVLAQVDDSVTFSDVRAMPDTYRGRTVLFSGVALKSQRVKDRTEIEVMQLPTTGSMSPSDRGPPALRLAWKTRNGSAPMKENLPSFSGLQALSSRKE